MSSQQHGISLGVLRTGDEYFLEFTAQGKLTHSDYQFILPLAEGSLSNIDNSVVKALVDIRDFEGWEPRAAWDELKFDFKHRKDFDRIAIVGSKQWEDWMTTLFGWIMSGEMQYFQDRGAALEWLRS